MQQEIYSLEKLSNLSLTLSLIRNQELMSSNGYVMQVSMEYLNLTLLQEIFGIGILVMIRSLGSTRIPSGLSCTAAGIRRTLILGLGYVLRAKKSDPSQ